MLLDEVCGRLEELGEKLDRLAAFNTSSGPMTRMFKRDLQYQCATIPAGGSGRVYYLTNPQPDLLMGIIIQVANSYFDDCYFEWFVDHLPKKVEYQIGEIHNPKHYKPGIPFEREIEWIAYNNSDTEHVFEVICDGHFIAKEIYNLIVDAQGRVTIPTFNERALEK